jgi:hypothetical protein
MHQPAEEHRRLGPKLTQTTPSAHRAQTKSKHANIQQTRASDQGAHILSVTPNDPSPSTRNRTDPPPCHRPPTRRRIQCLLARCFFWDKLTLSDFESGRREARRRAGTPTRSTLGGQPAGLTLRSSSRSGGEVQLKGSRLGRTADAAAKCGIGFEAGCKISGPRQTFGAGVLAVV